MSNESALEQLFPRIAQQLVKHWGHVQFEKYAAQLIIDSRGNRRGLDKAVLSELLFLYALHLDMFGYDSQQSFVPSGNPYPRTLI